MDINQIKASAYNPATTFEVTKDTAEQVETMPQEKIGLTLPSSLKNIKYSQIAAYYPNITASTPEARFDRAIQNSAKLSDGSIILQPMFLGSENNIEESNNKGEYIVTTQPIRMGAEPIVRTITEEQLVNSQSLYAGKAKQTENGNFDVIYMKKELDKNNNVVITPQHMEMTKKEFMEFALKNHLKF